MDAPAIFTEQNVIKAKRELIGMSVDLTAIGFLEIQGNLAFNSAF